MTRWSMDGGGGNKTGPFLKFYVEGSARKGVPPESFVLEHRDENADEDVTELLEQTGMVLDFPNMLRGWEKASGARGQRPQREMNRDHTRFEPAPGATGWKQYVALPVALRTASGTLRATLDGTGAGLWAGLRQLADDWNADPPDDDALLPWVKLTGTRPLTFNAGDTTAPVFQIVRAVKRPACLPAGGGYDEDGEGDPEPPPRAARPRQAASPAHPAPSPTRQAAPMKRRTLSQPPPKSEDAVRLEQAAAGYEEPAEDPAPRQPDGSTPTDRLRRQFTERQAETPTKRKPRATSKPAADLDGDAIPF